MAGMRCFVRARPEPAMTLVRPPLLAIAFIATTAHADQFIEQSRVIYPKQVGELTLRKTHFDRDNIGAGVALTYDLASQPGTLIDVFVYPAGRMSEADAIDAGIAGQEETIRMAAEKGVYSDVRMKGGKKLDLAVTEHTTLHGRMLSFEFTKDAVRFESRVLLLYRFDYYLKVRASTDAFEGAALDQAVVKVAAEVVPEIRVRNIGDCRPGPSFEQQVAEEQAKSPSERQRKSDSLFMTDRVDPAKLVEMLQAERIRLDESGCVDDFGEPSARVAKGEAYETIRFPKGAWE
jgi:hypothetical protein